MMNHQGFKQNKVSFYGHTLTEDGLLPSEDKLQAIKDIQAPTSTNELQTLLGMVTYLNRFSTKLAELQALDDIKKELCTKQLISYYDPDPNTVTILQCDHGQEKIVGMASRCLSPTESRYSNIERECLTVMFGLEKFEYYLLGRQAIFNQTATSCCALLSADSTQGPTTSHGQSEEGDRPHGKNGRHHQS
uniref:Reverse transcriptase/retrotransposon-derived protein RNase H-like domain-containing protein n=1 Tax=Oryzias latipes TaxID=8090 RepID=A0A3P9L1R3_ORYLA